MYLCLRMLKAFAAIMFFAFSVQCFQKGLIILSYFTNKSMFSSACQNKFRPAMNCEGKCVMMKKLLAEEEKQQKNPELKLENKVEVFQLSSTYTQLTLQPYTTTLPSPTNSTQSLTDWQADFFHPPAL